MLAGCSVLLSKCCKYNLCHSQLQFEMQNLELLEKGLVVMGSPRLAVTCARTA